MRVLHLGVIDQIYKSDEGKLSGSISTTGEVAQILEDNYGIMRTFVELHEDDIAKDIEESFADIIDNMSMGIHSPSLVIDFPDVEKMFQMYLTTGEWERVSGLFTEASLTRNSRKINKDDPKNLRPSFVDTGQYRAAFKAWMDAK